MGKGEIYLPHGFDSIFEKVIITSIGEIIGSHKMNIEIPKILYLHTK